MDKWNQIFDDLSNAQAQIWFNKGELYMKHVTNTNDLVYFLQEFEIFRVHFNWKMKIQSLDVTDDLK